MVHVYNCHPFSSQQIVQVKWNLTDADPRVRRVLLPTLVFTAFPLCGSGGEGTRTGLLWRWSYFCGGDWRMQGCFNVLMFTVCDLLKKFIYFSNDFGGSEAK